jgi:murein L,D-transpeptidase YafK
MGLLTAAAACTTAAPRSKLPRCTRSPSVYVAVHSSSHELVLCEAGHATRSFDVRLAKNGVGKQREGDGKLPLGTYALGHAVASPRFGLFLPIGYPTPAQRAQGATGSAVGVHGPIREAQWLGPLVNTFDTTEGCVGLATDDEVAEIDAFVAKHGATTIVID